MSNLLSYDNILKDIKQFKSSGSRYGDDFNLTDTPSQKYFKILFYFGSDPEFPNDNTNNPNLGGSGLLDPTWEYIPSLKYTSDFITEGNNASEESLKGGRKRFSEYNATLNHYKYNSAWSFLRLNDELERAEKLQHFITLLSDISAFSPWYFSTVTGIQEAIERKFTEDGKLDMTERKKLTITCLPDAFDNRIGTLLDLYRDITWSWVHKKEIIPANLRKFDMAIYIFEAPEKNWHLDGDIIDGKDDSKFSIGYKMIEFHDCEFNYNSAKTGWGELNNQTGSTPTYQIEILYNDCYEVSYNDIMMRTIGDVIISDLINASISEDSYVSYEQTNPVGYQQQLNRRLKPVYEDNTMSAIDKLTEKATDAMGINKTARFGNLETRKGSTGDIVMDYRVEYEPGFIGNAIGQAVGHAKQWVKGKINRALMGNLFTFSLTQMASQAKDLLGGNLIKTGMSIAEYVKEANARKDAKNKEKPTGDIFPDPPARIYTQIGNIYSGNTIANNL